MKEDRGQSGARRRFGRWAAAVSLAPLVPGPVAFGSERFPTRTVQVVVPFAPGDTDAMMRPFTDRMGEFLGQPAVLNYKPGAAGGVGASIVATSAPDGYTLLATTQGSIVVVPLSNKSIKYNTDSFAPVGALSEGGFLLAVAAKAPWKTLGELLDDSRAHPEKVSYSTSGANGVTHLLAEIFAREAKVRWVHVPHQGSGPAITALLGGHVDMASSAIAPAYPHLRSGALRALAVFGDQRLKALPDVPTLKELGFATVAPALYGLLAPSGTARAVIDTIFDAARKAAEKYQAAIDENLATLGAQVRLLGPDEYTAYVRSQHALFSRGIASLGG